MAKLNKRLQFQQTHFEKTIEILSKITLEASVKVKRQEQAIVEKQNQLRQVEAQIKEKAQVVKRLRNAVASMLQGSDRCVPSSQIQGPHLQRPSYSGLEGQVGGPSTLSRLDYQPNVGRQPGALDVSRQHKEKRLPPPLF